MKSHLYTVQMNALHEYLTLCGTLYLLKYLTLQIIYYNRCGFNLDRTETKRNHRLNFPLGHWFVKPPGFYLLQ